MIESASVASYRLSDAAEDDLRLIFEYGVDTWGVNLAAEFVRRIAMCLIEIAEAPVRFPVVEDIRAGYRRRVFEGHSIFYRIEGPEVVIVRILGRQDTGVHLSEA